MSEYNRPMIVIIHSELSSWLPELWWVDGRSLNKFCFSSYENLEQATVKRFKNLSSDMVNLR